MRYKVAIAGAGVGGLTAAAYLARAGHDVEIFDKFDAPSPVGSGLIVQPVGQAVLDDLDALDHALQLGVKITSMAGYEVDHGRKVLDVSYGKGFGLAIHRASLFEVLLNAARSAGAKLNTKAEVKEFDGQHVVARTGRHGPFDLIINASGANSGLSPMRSRALPYGAIWGSVPWPKDTEMPRNELRQRYQKANRMVGLLPIGSLPDQDVPLAAAFWSMPADGYDRWRDAPLDAWKAEACALWPEITPFLTQITSHDQMTMACYNHGTLLNPVRGRVVHLGDAAHRASPQLGQGANMALLDASALHSALTDPDIDIALLNYRRARRAHVWLYQLLSASFTPQYQSDSTVLPWLRDRLLFPLSQVPPAPSVLTRLVRGDIIPPLGSLRG